MEMDPKIARDLGEMLLQQVALTEKVLVSTPSEQKLYPHLLQLTTTLLQCGGGQQLCMVREPPEEESGEGEEIPSEEEEEGADYSAPGALLGGWVELVILQPNAPSREGYQTQGLIHAQPGRLDKGIAKLLSQVRIAGVPRVR
jgi:hypothetical protein